MRKILSLFFVIVMCTVSAFAGDGAKVEFAEKSHDFGSIKEEKGKVSHEFVFTNTGDEPLVVISANASCGCTVPDYPKDPIKPGKTGKIKVTYNPSGRPGEFTKSIKVRFNQSKKSSNRVTLKISGTVVPKASK
jgi:hypothetical protein